ncbi:MAG TPA: lytic murein transglycosylase [Rhizomicrobium sp.]|jgi:membrane-bound lytic murein transglycosylase B|nr:lytic murein transglycosylase [Rhizomicrobium sp.]
MRIALATAVFAGAPLLAWGQAPAVAQGPINTYSQAQIQDSKFRDFVGGFRTSAIQAGIDSQLYDAAMAPIARNPRVEELNLEQPEFVKPIWVYLASAISPERVATGQQRLTSDRAMLDAVEARFGVQREILVAIWGIESDYGREMGGFNIFEALATLAYDGPRADFGRRELLDALRIAQQEHFRPDEMTSSWAGAFGQTQFVPSAFLHYAVDGDGDGRRDLWHSPADALASAANLLAQSSWERGAPWGYQVSVPESFPYEDADLGNVQTITFWRNLGVRATVGWKLPVSDARASIYLPAGAGGPAFIVFDNFRTLLKYNNAASYALAVCLLADGLRGYAPIAARWPTDMLPLSRSETIALQSDLARLGFASGSADGLLGSQTRKAVRAYQKSRGLIPDGYASEPLFARIEQELGGRGTTGTESRERISH